MYPGLKKQFRILSMIIKMLMSKGFKVKIDFYSKDFNYSEVFHQEEIFEFINYKGYTDSKNLCSIQKNADFLLHFRTDSVFESAHSMSSKLNEQI